MEILLSMSKRTAQRPQKYFGRFREVVFAVFGGPAENRVAFERDFPVPASIEDAVPVALTDAVTERIQERGR